MNDHFKTLAQRCEHRQKIERSEFIGIAFHVESDDDFFSQLASIVKKHFDATHHCWAFRLRSRSRSSDAGEPPGTAGKPILGAIEAADLVDAAAVVVRWFGGVKLGTGGLSRAYRSTAAETLRRASIQDLYVYTRFVLTVAFDEMSLVYRLLDPPNVILIAEHFGETNEFEVDVWRSQAQTFARTLTERRVAFRTKGEE